MRLVWQSGAASSAEPQRPHHIQARGNGRGVRGRRQQAQQRPLSGRGVQEGGRDAQGAPFSRREGERSAASRSFEARENGRQEDARQDRRAPRIREAQEVGEGSGERPGDGGEGARKNLGRWKGHGAEAVRRRLHLCRGPSAASAGETRADPEQKPEDRPEALRGLPEENSEERDARSGGRDSKRGRPDKSGHHHGRLRELSPGQGLLG
mmetsp:Transcript_10878/g.40728  ORF Transcript_10878/g.40728 Transcript_10878/m.40728 type:complete len:209 (-) Transcript_10878:328-954(-)